MNCEICEDIGYFFIHGISDESIKFDCDCNKIEKITTVKENKNSCNVCKVETYTGTVESAGRLVKRLYLEGEHSFNIIDKSLLNTRDGIKYIPGDSYQYLIHEKKIG